MAPPKKHPWEILETRKAYYRKNKARLIAYRKRRYKTHLTNVRDGLDFHSFAGNIAHGNKVCSICGNVIPNGATFLS